MTKFDALLKKQRTFFKSGASRDIDFRLNALDKLMAEIRRRKRDIEKALFKDLGRAAHESYMAEIGFTLAELEHIKRNIKKWARDEKVRTSLANFPSKAFIRREPYGICLIMSPWNYPFMLTLTPLAGAIAAGNCAVVKPSAYSPETSIIIEEIIKACFAEEYISVVLGGREENKELLEQRFDFIFFTGSVSVGKIVMEKASKHLCPVILELGGKSPAIVDESANLKVCARRLVFGKYLNAGQTCVAPDYLLVQESVKNKLLEEIKLAIKENFGDKPLENKELPKLVNKKHFDRVKSLIEGQEIYSGGKDDGISRIEPTVLINVSPESPVMQEEIFGPVLPAISFKKINEAVEFVNKGEKPLALYLFTQNKNNEKLVLDNCSFGGGCINDTIMHLSENKLGFGGVGHSGMGNYHGRRSYTAFSHEKSILKKGTWFDLPLRYHPYTDKKYSFIQKYWK